MADFRDGFTGGECQLGIIGNHPGGMFVIPQWPGPTLEGSAHRIPDRSGKNATPNTVADIIVYHHDSKTNAGYALYQIE